MRKVLGWILLLVGSWMLVSPQALLGLPQLKWMAKSAFPAEVLLGILVVSISYYLIDFKVDLNEAGKAGH